MSAKHWNLLVPNRVADLPPAAQFAAYAIAYLDSAQRLCTVLAHSHKKASFERGAVVLYLAAHAVELFLKGAILRKSPKERFSHDLEHLHSRYETLYPGKHYHLEIPFKSNYPPGISSVEKSNMKALSPPTDQLYRYPSDKEGKSWFGVYSFEAGSFQEELNALRQKFDSLLSAYDG